VHSAEGNQSSFLGCACIVTVAVLPLVSLSDASSQELDVFFALRQSFNQREQGVGGGDQFEFGGGVDGLEFLGDQHLPGI
jgi:hypothetical protein